MYSDDPLKSFNPLIPLFTISHVERWEGLVKEFLLLSLPLQRTESKVTTNWKSMLLNDFRYMPAQLFSDQTNTQIIWIHTDKLMKNHKNFDQIFLVIFFGYYLRAFIFRLNVIHLRFEVSSWDRSLFSGLSLACEILKQKFLKQIILNNQFNEYVNINLLYLYRL